MRGTNKGRNPDNLIINASAIGANVEDANGQLPWSEGMWNSTSPQRTESQGAVPAVLFAVRQRQCQYSIQALKDARREEKRSKRAEADADRRARHLEAENQELGHKVAALSVSTDTLKEELASADATRERNQGLLERLEAECGALRQQRQAARAQMRYVKGLVKGMRQELDDSAAEQRQQQDLHRQREKQMRQSLEQQAAATLTESLEAHAPGNTTYTLAPCGEAAAGAGAYGEVVFVVAQDVDPVTGVAAPPRKLVLKMATTDLGRDALRNESKVLSSVRTCEPAVRAAVPYLEVGCTELELPDGAGAVSVLLEEAGECSVTARGDQLMQARDFKRLKQLMLNVESAISGMHAAGLLHGDIKPCNLVVMADGSVKVIDFGGALTREDAASVTPSFARSLHISLAPPPLRWASSSIGAVTPGFQQPEDLRQSRPMLLGQDFDLYSQCMTMLDLIGVSAWRQQRDKTSAEFERDMYRTYVTTGFPVGLAAMLQKVGCDRCVAEDIGAYIGEMAKRAYEVQ
eukprot:jgi/Tetstr1/429320/TSEL_019238.t1